MWDSDSIIAATSGTLHGNAFTASSVGIDSRKLPQGALFVALKGERVDGHDYVQSALANGAAAALVQHVPPGMQPSDSLIVVSDTYKALLDMAVAARKRTTAKIIAVTGSVGKTGTKEAIRTVLASAGSVYATQGNLNNHIGLPLSLANLPHDAHFGVFELGMNHAGEISFLTRLARPDIAVITNVEAVHLEFFASVEAIADAKAEIMEGLPKDGTIILNRDNKFYEQLHARAKKFGIKNIVTFGSDANAQCRLMHYVLKGMSSQVEAVMHGTSITYGLGTIGYHYALTSVVALAAAMAAGADLADAAAALAHFHEPEGRGKLHRVKLLQGSVTLIDDCYNASPSSMKAGIAKLAELHASLNGVGRKVAVLGDMLELGASGAELHKSLLETLMQYNINKVYAAGPLMKNLFDILPAPMRGCYEKNAAQIAQIVLGELQENDVVLIKGSHGSHMDIVRDTLMTTTHTKTKESADAV